MEQARCLRRVTLNGSLWSSRSGPAADSEASRHVNKYKRRQISRQLYKFYQDLFTCLLVYLYTLFNLQDLELEFASGRFRLDDIANFVIHERAANRRFIGNFAITRVGFFGSHQIVRFRIKTFLLHSDMRTDRDYIAMCFFHNDGCPQDRFDLLNATFEEALVFL